jgi:hypothetical protein
LDLKQKAKPSHAMRIIISSGKISPILATLVCRGLDMIQGPMMQSSMASLAGQFLNVVFSYQNGMFKIKLEQEFPTFLFIFNRLAWSDNHIKGLFS